MNEHTQRANDGRSDSPPENPPSSENRQVSQLDQLLVAYLDGELDERSAAELESRLATDEALRSRLHEYQKTWDMLDAVETKGPDEAFVKSTIEMVVTGTQARARKWHRWPVRVALGLAALVAPGVAAFTAIRHYQNQPYRDFVSQLEFWENVDMYDQVDSLQFVQRMRAEGWFEEALSDE